MSCGWRGRGRSRVQRWRDNGLLVAFQDPGERPSSGPKSFHVVHLLCLNTSDITTSPFSLTAFYSDSIFIDKVEQFSGTSIIIYLQLVKIMKAMTHSKQGKKYVTVCISCGSGTCSLYITTSCVLL